MELQFWPEGRLLATQANLSHCATVQSLEQAMESGTVLEGMATLCQPDRSLRVQLGPHVGLIPREEGAIGVADGSTREIALLSRVGKPVSVVVTGFLEDGTPLLSRRKAQELARDAMLRSAQPGDILPATVTHLEPFGAFVDLGCGLPSMLGVETISISRIPHPDQRFTVGQEIFVVVTGIDRAMGRLYLTHKELLGTWADNAAGFSVGMTVPGIVRGVKDYGAFVELSANLSGLAELREDLKEGDRVSVYLKSILPERMKIKLLVIGKLPRDTTLPPLRYFQTEGRLDRWEYAPRGCSKVGAISIFSP